VIVEPVAGNMNCVPPVMGFLEGLRELCDDHGAVLIFDEVMTGFRAGLHGAQGRFGVTPDMSALGKVIGGGLPVGAFGGKRAIMEQLVPSGAVYQAGTLAGNPLATAAGLATLEIVSEDHFFDELERRTDELVDALTSAAREAGVPLASNRVGGMFGLFFNDGSAVRTFDDAKGSDTTRFARFFHTMLANGVYMAPAAFEAGFMSAAHDDNAIEATVEAARAAFAQIAAVEA